MDGAQNKLFSFRATVTQGLTRLISPKKRQCPSCLACMDLRYWDKSELPKGLRLKCVEYYTRDQNFFVEIRYDGLSLSAASCEICALLYEGVEVARGTHVLEPWVRLKIDNYGSRMQYQFRVSSLPTTQLEFYTDQETPETMKPKAPIPKLSHVPPTMDSKIAALKARAWLEECLKSHPRCSEVEKPILPRRVIRLSSRAADPQLYETSHGQRGDYVALSYCWGLGQHFKTIQDNLSSHIAGIPWNKIPKTLQDSMHFTIELGVEFIWIDALCIIQDDYDDWKEQASAMGSIYENALLTLSASASPDTGSGCFSQKRDQKFKLSRRLSSLGAFDIYMRRACDLAHTTLFHHQLGRSLDMHDFPILTRGWTFQERILSRRTLHCGPEKLAWECISKIDCECSSVLELDGIPQTKSIIDRRLHTENPKVWEFADHPLRQWLELTVSYASRQFTRPSDRLIALEGIASKFQNFGLGPYFFGLWGENLALQLNWYSSESVQRLDLPSWSWASIYGQCGYRDHPFTEGSTSSLIDVIKLPTDLSPDDTISSRSLTISSAVADARLRLEGEGEPKVGVVIGRQWHKLSEDVYQTKSVQAEERLSDGEAAVCMELSTYSGHRKSVFGLNGPLAAYYAKTWLVLRRAFDQEDVYKRVGLLHISNAANQTPADFMPVIEKIDRLAERRTLRII